MLAGATPVLVHNSGPCGIAIDTAQLKKKYNKHAADFGLPENYNFKNGEKWAEGIRKHVNSSKTLRFGGIYRGDDVVHHLDPSTGLNVLHTVDGHFISGWKLNPQQLNNVLMRGSL
ncbi:colicin D domain-containing protein [Streptomyces phaeochromogenes]|uniref:colicin D domain-containing protein n=1 Tax=Streptomyces phaeochromogenes TaxID=1923 RepID=UPI0033DEC01B